MITIRICNFRSLLAPWLFILAMAACPIAAQESGIAVPQTWQMLDYLATDYAGAVKDGAVVSASEYAEMREFADTVRSRIQSLPLSNATPDLLRQADTLSAAIAAKAPSAHVATLAHALADALLVAYPIPTTPERTPDLTRGAALFQSQCAACHGATGRGDGPAGIQLQPRPVDFTDQARADQRSALSLFEVISQGVPDTPMVSYAQLSAADRWALAYYVGSLAYQKEALQAPTLLRGDGQNRALLGAKDLSRARVSQLAPTLGVDEARAILGFLRAHPEAAEQTLRGIPLARARLEASLAAFRAGAKEEATRLALSAYLDGVEPVEPQLNARDSSLRATLETAMGAYRTALSKNTTPDAVAKEAANIDALLARAEAVTAQSGSDAVATFLGGFTILLREGMEALLIVVGLLAFLRKAGQPQAVRHVHAGWVMALVAGVITWAIASFAISISGANREVTEGLSSLFAAAVLLSVGLWMHQKSVGNRWQSYLKGKMASALNRRSAWFLFALAFISVYREVFETILFYVALWNQGQNLSLLGGIAAGAVALGAIAWLLLRTSRRLPIGTFFSASSMLIAVLTVVLAGKGVAALQEAGWIGIGTVPIPRIDLLGIFPTWQSVVTQLAVVLLLAIGFAYNIRQGSRIRPASADASTPGAP